MALISLSVTLLLTTLFFRPTIADNSSPDIIHTFCSNTQTPNPESFDVNFVDAMENISKDIAKSGFGSADAATNGSYRAYGLGQCFGYLSSINCQLCYAQSRVKLPHCLPAVVGRIFLDGCFLAYADYNFAGDPINGSDFSVCGSSKITSNSIVFNETTSKLMQNLTTEAYKDRAFYKVGNVTSSSGVKIYGMAQCWKSLNESACQECLESTEKSVIGCLPASDGKAMNAGCFVRYSTEPFYEASVSNSSGSSAVRRRVGVALGCIFAAAVVLGAAFLWARMRRSSATTEDEDDPSADLIRSISESRLGFKYEVLARATDSFNQRNKLGQGGFGSVYKGILPDGREVAVKRLFINTRQWVDQFFNEVNLISRVQHKNLVKLLGCSVEGPESLLVYEYMRNTSLDQFLFDSFKKNELGWQRRFDIIVGTAEGIAYLHEASEVRIIHRDIKASNILLDERFKPKIADFGLARYFAEGQSHLSTGVAGTLGYMAPEYVVHGQLTEKADIYSYGILVLEVVTGRRNNSLPTSGENHSLMSLIWAHYNSKTLFEMLDPSLRGQCSEEEALNVFLVGLLCTQASPSLRPPMWKVVEMLSKGRDLPLPTQPPFINIKGAKTCSHGSESSHLSSSSLKSPVSVNQMSQSIMTAR